MLLAVFLVSSPIVVIGLGVLLGLIAQTTDATRGD